VQRIPLTADAAWDFFSSPVNLNNITPADMSFKIISVHHGDRMYAGQVIEYKLRPVLNIPVYWMTEITHVEDKKYFVDEQRFGPFSMWHHQHHFKAVEGGVEMTDIIHYKLPLWFLGDIANALFVKRKLKKVFDYRYSKIEKLFGSVSSRFPL
jgi:ligand-binding SRPBCC domain-containing protein